MGGGGSNIPANTSSIKRYAKYIETRHEAMLANTFTRTDYVINDSPYDSYTDINIADAYFSIGLTISSFSSLYDMYGKFMSGLDVEVIWKDTFDRLLSQDEVNTIDVISGIAKDDIAKTKSMLSIEMRNLNAVNSSSFMIKKAQIEGWCIKILADYNAERKYSILALANNEAVKTLNWNKDVITAYAINMQNYFMAGIDGDAANYGKLTENKLWSFVVLDFERAVLATMRRGVMYQKVAYPRERSDVSKVLYIASTTAQGAYIGGPIGATIGFTLGLAQMIFE